jgi:glutaredoxin
MTTGGRDMKQHALACLLAGTTLLGMGTSLQAQTVYRIVGADGKVTFSDKPPASAEQGKVASTGVGAKTDSSATALPFELRQVAAKYPVVLYTSAKCPPCDTGRTLLMSRGVPFNERTVSTQEDRDYLQRLTSDNSLPYLTIGSQRIKGMSDVEWTQYLDAAGYPQKSALPAAYKYPVPTPLVSVQKAPTANAAEKPPATAAEPANQPPPPSPSNPAGITF